MNYIKVAFEVERKRSSCVKDIGDLQILLFDSAEEPIVLPERNGACGIAADIEDNEIGIIVECGIDFRRQRRYLNARGDERGHQKTYSCLFYLLMPFGGTEIGIDDIEVNEGDFFALRSLIECNVKGKFALARAEMPYYNVVFFHDSLYFSSYSGLYVPMICSAAFMPSTAALTIPPA